MALTPDLKEIANRTRISRQGTYAVLAGVVILGLFLFVPLGPKNEEPAAAIAIASTTPPNAFANIPLTARAAVVYDMTTGKTLYAKNANAQLPLASLTKLLTMYAALSKYATSTTVTIPQDVMGLSAPHAFTPGQQFALGNLARITLVASLNDGAAAIAQMVADNEHTDVSTVLAGAAASLGLTQTYAVNGNGLDMNTAISGGYGSARDIAKLAGTVAMRWPSIASATTHPTAQADSLAGTHFQVKNTDPVVNTIPGLMLSKTGYTDLAGGNLALVFDAGLNHPIAVVVLGSTIKDRFTDGQALVAATLAHFAGVKSL